MGNNTSQGRKAKYGFAHRTFCISIGKSLILDLKFDRNRRFNIKLIESKITVEKSKKKKLWV